MPRNDTAIPCASQRQITEKLLLTLPVRQRLTILQQCWHGPSVLDSKIAVQTLFEPDYCYRQRESVINSTPRAQLALLVASEAWENSQR